MSVVLMSHHDRAQASRDGDIVAVVRLRQRSVYGGTGIVGCGNERVELVLIELASVDASTDDAFGTSDASVELILVRTLVRALGQLRSRARAQVSQNANADGAVVRTVL